jgi:mono/diheme cytochrome c family protein
MGKFLAGLVLGMLLVPAIFLIFALTGRLSIAANFAPPAWERTLAWMALQKSIARQAPEQKNPVAPTEENLLAGMKLFRDGCEGCHGGGLKKSRWGSEEFYPRVPQFGFEPPEISEAQIFWVAKNGIRYSGMGGNPAEGGYSDEQMWKLATFLSHLKSLPPRVAAEWQKKSS